MSRKSDHHPLRLTILATYSRYVNGVKKWFYLCRCVCGTEKEIYKYSVDYGLTRSCGCLHREVSAVVGTNSATHGDASRMKGVATEYDIWRGILKRCYNTNDEHYPTYGGRGISVCPQWRTSYETFLADVGRRPSQRHTIDRFPNNDGNYEPGNVRWATKKQQGRNRRTNTLFTFNGKTQCASAWAEEYGFDDRHIILVRIKRGWSIQRALTTPPRKN